MVAALLHVDGVRHVARRVWRSRLYKALALFGDDDRVVHKAGESHAPMNVDGVALLKFMTDVRQ